ncbi:hypothetical protein [Bdellovibrio sp. KM01]|uniref:hypothetical protein n=1 Tax=Bdellovibrio sp. KM01 TaxID=2748865 RepID=UPI0015EA63C7|nr:hypothetical protein [Bdellovibrio sp. KM01]QLY26505.1 hypothetical protein HW988_05645 [Bdellovibrio sp. KM01]
MKNKLLVGTVLSLSMAQPAHAVPEESQFAVLKPEKSCQVKAPSVENQAPIYFSKDCNTAYVLPQKNIKAVKSWAKLPGAADRFCKEILNKKSQSFDYDAKIASLSAELDQVILKITEAPPEKKDLYKLQIKELRKQIAYYTKRKNDIFGIYDLMPALRVKYTLEDRIMQNVEAYRVANELPDGSNGPTKFTPALITSSTLVISRKSAKTTVGKTILNVDFPSYRVPAVAGVTLDPEATYVAMNGGLTGLVDISTSAYCNSKDNREDLERLISETVALNLAYKVNVQTGIKLDVNATIKTTDFLNNIESYIERGKYTRRDFTQGVIAGGLDNSLSITIDDKGRPYSFDDYMKGVADGEELSPFARIINKSIQQYFTRAENKLKQLGIFSEEPIAGAPEILPGTEDVATGTRQVCSSNSGFFGIGASRSCSTQTIYTRVDRNGVSELTKDIKDDSWITERITLEANQTTTVDHTSGFN